MSDAIQVLNRLNDVRRSGSGHMARCPAHEDRVASLSIKGGDDGRVLLYCHAGCRIEAIVQALGLTMRDLNPNSCATSRPSGRAIVMTYDYEDAKGQLLFQVVRYEPKDFRQRRPDGKGGWLWNLKGLRRVPYRLPKLRASDPAEPVFIVEGEKDADRLDQINLTATCNPGGAGKWRETYNKHLRDRHVVILPDNDHAGRKHADQVARSLDGVAASVRIVALPDMPDKSDVSDWLSNGGTGEALLELVEQTPLWTAAVDPEAAGDPEAAAESIPYTVRKDGLFWLKPTANGQVPVHLTNFNARIVADVTHDDGVETRRAFEIEARLGDSYRRFKLPAPRFAGMAWVVEHLGAQALIFPGFAIKDHARAAIQMLSTDIAHRRVYAHTGWRQLEKGWVYLHAGGAIGQVGQVEDVDVELPTTLERYVLPVPPTADELRAAVRASLKLLDVAPEHVSLPLLALAYRAVLGSCSFALHTAGQTGTGKTELAALVQQHFGAEMNAEHLPASWTSTANANEGLAFTVKDSLLVVDDFAPCGSQYDIQRFHRDADRLIRAQGNRSGRQRMRSDATLRPHKPPRGVILSTGEDIPKGHSVRARMLVVEVGPDDVDWGVLTECQRGAAAGLYAGSMAGFIQWLSSRYESVRKRLRPELFRLRQEAFRSGQHRRTPDIVANLAVGLKYFLEFAENCGAVTAEEHGDLWKRGWAALGRAAEAQAAHHRASEPTQRFVELLASALASGHAHVADTEGAEPANARGWGWRQVTVGTGSYQRDEWRPQGDRIGWVADDDLYLDPDASYKVAQQMAAGDGITVAARTLRKRLHERNLLRSTEQETRQTLTVRRFLEDSRRQVLHLRASLVMRQEPDQLDQPDPKPGSGCQNAEHGQFPGSVSGVPPDEIRPQDLTTDAGCGLERPLPRDAGRVGQVGQVSPPRDGQSVGNGNSHTNDQSWGEI